MQVKKSKENKKNVLCSIVSVQLFNSIAQNAFWSSRRLYKTLEWSLTTLLDWALSSFCRAGLEEIVYWCAMPMLPKIYISIRRAAWLTYSQKRMICMLLNSQAMRFIPFCQRQTSISSSTTSQFLSSLSNYKHK